MTRHHFSTALISAMALTAAACSAEQEAEPDGDAGSIAAEENGAAQGTANGGDDATDADRAMDALVKADAGGDSARTSSPAKTATQIPAAFRGTWARTSADCAARNHNRLTIGAKQVSFFEGGGTARAIRTNGNALAVTFADAEIGPDVVYFARESDERIRVKMGNGPSRDYLRCPVEGASAGSGGTSSATVPTRFRGTFAPDRQACAEDYDYQPTFQNVDVTADRVQYFENGGPVQGVEVDGNSIAIDYLDTYGDQRTPQVIYLALEGDSAVRYRPSRTDPVRRFVRCD